MIAEVPLSLVLELRAKLRDYPEINYLYSGKETQDQEYARLVYEAMEKISSTPPVFSDTWNFRSGFPRALITYLLDLAMALSLREVSLWMMRNDFQWQAGNTSIRLFDRWRAYQTIYPALMQEAQSAIREWKVAYNMERAYGACMTELFDSSKMVETRDWVSISV
jgi:hypothetical protein